MNLGVFILPDCFNSDFTLKIFLSQNVWLFVLIKMCDMLQFKLGF